MIYCERIRDDIEDDLIEEQEKTRKNYWANMWRMAVRKLNKRSKRSKSVATFGIKELFLTLKQNRGPSMFKYVSTDPNNMGTFFFGFPVHSRFKIHYKP